MSMLEPNAQRSSSRAVLWGGLAIIGLVLAGCKSSSPSSPPPADCDTTVPLNHCGAYMPQYNPNNHS